MTRDEFIDKLESEGMSYAFTGYGLSEDDLDPELEHTPFWTAVKDARIAFQRAEAFGHRIYSAVE